MASPQSKRNVEIIDMTQAIATALRNAVPHFSRIQSSGSTQGLLTTTRLRMAVRPPRLVRHGPGAVMAAISRRPRFIHDGGMDGALVRARRFYTGDKDDAAPSRREFVAQVRPLIEAVYNKLPLDFSLYAKVHEVKDDYVLWRKGDFHVLSINCRGNPASILFPRPTLSIPLSPSDEECALASAEYRADLARRMRAKPDVFFPYSLEFHSEYDVLEGRPRKPPAPRQER